MYYILDKDHVPQPADLMTWARAFENAEARRVGEWASEDGTVRVSTVFLGIDHSFGGPRPLLFETMVFGGPLDMEQERYTTCGAAVAGHAAMVARAVGVGR